MTAMRLRGKKGPPGPGGFVLAEKKGRDVDQAGEYSVINLLSIFSLSPSPTPRHKEEIHN